MLQHVKNRVVESIDVRCKKRSVRARRYFHWIPPTFVFLYYILGIVLNSQVVETGHGQSD